MESYRHGNQEKAGIVDQMESLPNLYVIVLNPNVRVFGNRTLKEVIKVK